MFSDVQRDRRHKTGQEQAGLFETYYSCAILSNYFSTILQSPLHLKTALIRKYRITGLTVIRYDHCQIFESQVNKQNCWEEENQRV
jgi:hypothetical protein